MEKRLLRLIARDLNKPADNRELTADNHELTATEARAILRRAARMNQLKVGQAWVGNGRSYEDWQRYVARERSSPNRPRQMRWSDCYGSFDLESQP
jgi:hypothetical protein